MATFTLANFCNSDQLFAEIRQPLRVPSYPKPRGEFLVFPTGETEYHWRIAALATNRTVSRHKSLIFALRKCSSLNQQHEKSQRDPLKAHPRPIPNAKSRTELRRVANDGR